MASTTRSEIDVELDFEEGRLSSSSRITGSSLQATTTPMGENDAATHTQNHEQWWKKQQANLLGLVLVIIGVLAISFGVSVFSSDAENRNVTADLVIAAESSPLVSITPSMNPTPPTTIYPTYTSTQYPTWTRAETYSVEEVHTACLTMEDCKKRSKELGIDTDMYFYANNFETKGCFSKNNKAFFSLGTDDEMTTTNLIGIRERIWCHTLAKKKCFADGTELRNAVRQYVNGNCANNNTECMVTQIYGWPMNSWCVENVTDMTRIFYDMRTFNEDISRWNVSSVVTFDDMFWGASSFNCDLSDWDTRLVTNMEMMFTGATSFNGNISSWNVSSVKNMRSTFLNARSFNQDLSDWDTSSVIDMTSLFSGAKSFNQDLSNWNTSRVTGMWGVFSDASSFNNDFLSKWDVSSVNEMSYMFLGATNFNGSISSWDVSSVKSMDSMFMDASSFDVNISTWNVSSVTKMGQMFSKAVSFNQDLSKWDISSVNEMNFMFASATSFQQNLCEWGDNFPYNSWGIDTIFAGSGCTFQESPQEERQEPFCAQFCRGSISPSSSSSPSMSASPTPLPSSSSSPTETCYWIEIEIAYSHYPEEISWELHLEVAADDGGGGALIRSHAGSEGDTSYAESICLQEGDYKFTIYDEWDSMYCCRDSHAHGCGHQDCGYSVTSNGDVIVDVWDRGESTSFSIPFSTSV